MNRKRSTKSRRRKLWIVHPFCSYCGKQVTLKESTLDHVQARASGGSNHATNTVLCCGPCNQKKGAKKISEFLAEGDQ